MNSALSWKGDKTDSEALRREIKRLEARVLALENKEPVGAGKALVADPEKEKLRLEAERAEMEKVVEVSAEDWESRWLRH